MNKQELIEYCESLKGSLNKFINGIDVNKIIKKIEQLNEPQKVTVPQFMADYIKDAKYYEWDLDDAFDHIAEESEESEIYKWFYTLGNIDVFARAWLDGYEVEKEKRYIVTVKNIGNDCKYLKWNGVQRYWYFGNGKNLDDIRLYHTLENLQKGGFGNVFVNPLFTIKEVEE